MPLSKPEHDRLANLPAAAKNTSIQNDVDVIHRCVNSGTVDRDSINDALERIAAVLGQPAPTSRPLGSPKPLGTPRVSG